MEYRFCKFGYPDLFSDHAVDFLLRNEAVNSILLSMINDISSNTAPPPFADELFYGSVVRSDRKDQPLFITVQRKGFNLALYGSRDPEIIRCGVEGIISSGLDLVGTIGPQEITAAFTERYCESTGASAAIEMKQLIYRLDDLEEIGTVEGTLTRADRSSNRLLLEWMRGFGNDIGLHRKNGTDDINDRVVGMIAKGSAYLFVCDERPVSVAIHSRSSRNGASISGVYTPPELRGRGYATACVHNLAKMLLESGYKFCCLYADANFPTSNRIYQRIGFNTVETSVVYRFTESLAPDD